LVAVPSQYRLIVKDSMKVDTASLRLCISGGERLADTVASDFEARFCLPLLQGYGATEAGPCISVNTPRTHRFGTVGPPLPNLRVTLRQDGHEQPVGQTGEIWVEGPNVMLGYYNRPEATAEKLVSRALRTGDLGFLDADGFLHLAGRTDDLVKVAGEKIYPSEVERVLEQVEGVEEAVVVGVPDEKHGMVLRAFVQPRPGARLTEASLHVACRERLEAMKIPRHILVIDQLPRTLTGKADVRALAALPKP
jgi:long-chain acyl-CoA synthetase